MAAPCESPHAQSTEDVLAALDASPKGLSARSADDRLRRYGPNALPEKSPPTLLETLLRQFKSPLIYILLFAGVAAFAIGDWEDAAFILLVLTLNAVIGAAQELRAERSAAALRTLVLPKAHVLRDGDERVVDSRELVPGDVVVIETGSKVPADLRLLSGAVEIDESLLTGESTPSGKHAKAEVAPDAAVGDRKTMAFAGTIVSRGRAYGVVVATATDTQLGRIAASLAETDSTPPPLLVRMERFSRQVALAVLGTVLVLGGLMVARGESLATVFLGSVALAVSAIPEGLPVAMTVALAIGVRRMSQRKVIARRLAAVEALGSCTFIASDKTGTLTRNELTVTQVLLPGSPTPVDVPDQPLSPDGPTWAPGEEVTAVARAAALCNDASLSWRDGALETQGDAVDVALLVMAERLGISRAGAEVQTPRRAAIPFEAERRFAAVVVETPQRHRVFVKGAAERVLLMCQDDGTGALEEAGARAEALAAGGYRVLALAVGPGAVLDDGEVDPSCLAGLKLLGFVGMLDPLRPEAAEAVRQCHRSGIEVAMVTGDHPETATTIARELGLIGDGQRAVTGVELKQAREQGPEAYRELVRGTRVFARVEPQDKLEVVQALIESGHFVAVTGDGANDAPAMRAAHIGVAMGERGTDVAKETGELVVTDDNFASIVAGVQEGRIAYANVRHVIFLLVSSGAAELVLFALSIGAGLPLPLLPAQILWLNLVTNGIQDVALAFEPGDGTELNRPPRPPREPIFDRLMIRRVLISAVVMGGVSFVAFDWMLDQGWTVDAARNALLLLLVLFENVQAGNSRSEHKSVFALSPMRNPILFVGTAIAQLLHIAAMATPGLQDILDAEPVSLSVWLTLLALALTLLLASEAEKWLRHIGAASRPAGAGGR